MKTRLCRLALTAGLTVPFAYVGSAPCFGQGTIYRDRSEFDLAIADLTGIRADVNFQPPLPPGGFDDGIGVRYFLPLTMSGMTFRSGGALYIRQVSGFPDFNRVLNGYDSLTPLTVDMNGPALAFGADFGSLASSSFLATVTLNNGTTYTFTAPANPNLIFFGLVTTQPFSSLTFSDGALIGLHEEILDNVTVVTIPEPDVWALLTLGALFLGWRWHKIRKP